MKNYLNLVEEVINTGAAHQDRTGVGTRRVFGRTLEFDLAKGFPVLSARRVPWRSAIGEMHAFLNGYNTVEQFESVGCRFWGANAKGWQSDLADGNYLGRIYGQQARAWKTASNTRFDQLENVFEQIQNNPNSRRLLVTHWRPDEFDQMALPPCHVQYQFFVDDNTQEMSLKFDMRSTDLILGAPNNIVGYAFLLWATAHAFDYTPRKLFMTMGDCHVYNDHIEGAKLMMQRSTANWVQPSWLTVNPTNPPPRVNQDGSQITHLDRLNWVLSIKPSNLQMLNYQPMEHIEFKMAV